MRFETPQTTPSFLNRRFQHGMLLFAGFISLVLFALGVAYGPTTTRQENQANVPGDLQTSSSDRLRPDRDAQNSGTFVATAQIDNDGPRGQWSETNSRERSPDIAVGQDREPFQRRGQERLRDTDPFPRRSPIRDDADELRSDDNLVSQENPTMEDDRDERLLPKDLNTRDSRVSDPQIDGTLDPFAETVPSNRRESDRVRNRSNSDDDPSWLQEGSDRTISRNEQPLPGSNFLPGSNSLPGGTALPSDIPLPGSNSLPDRADDFLQDNGNRDIDSVPRSSNPTKRRFRNQAPQRDFDRGDLAGRVGDLADPPLNNRRSRDRTEDSPTDSGAFQGDVASVRIDKRYLDLVKDNTVGIRRDEAEVFYWLLDHARRVASSELERAGLTQVQYINLMTEPDHFRGEPITIEGDLWALYEFDAGRNDYGVSRVYEGWVFTGDSGNHPFRVVFTSLPRGITPGEKIRKPVRITGYFFKREGYQSQGGIHFAPVLLARKIHINPLPNGLSFPSGFTPHVVGVIMAMGLALLVTIIGFSISDDRSSKEQMQRMRRYPQLSFASLPPLDFTSVEESLRQLSEREHNSAIRGAYGPLLSRQTLREHAMKSYPLQSVTDSLTDPHRQADAVHNWASRQQQIQLEIDALRTSPATISPQTAFDDDELNADQFDPARNLLPKVSKPVTPISRPESISHPVPISFSSTVSPPPVPYESFPREQMPIDTPVVTNPHPVVSQLHSVVTTNPSNIDYRASKLSEWEDEISKMQSRGSGLRSSNLTGAGPGEEVSRNTVADQIERDREARERSVQEQLHHPHAHQQFEPVPEPHRDFETQVEQEWAEHERHPHGSHPLTHDQTQFDLADEDLPLDADELPPNYDHPSSTHDQPGHGYSSSKPDWNRHRKRRRNWRDGNVS